MLRIAGGDGDGQRRPRPSPVLWYGGAAVQRCEGHDGIIHSASDLVGFLECRHLAALERAAVLGHLKRPMRRDAFLDRIVQRGYAHERRFLDALAAEGREVVELTLDESVPSRLERYAAAQEATLAAMREGRDVIFQAALFDGERLGFADFLVRADAPGAPGPRRYEVWDTKLARSVKASAVLQLCRYSDMVGALQGAAPEKMHLALGGAKGETVSFRVADYAAYYRSVERRFDAFLRDDAPAWPLPTKPEPVGHCDVCRWRPRCRAEWKADDHLSLVAGIGRGQRDALRAHGVDTRTALGERHPGRVEGLSAEGVERVHRQAAIQLRGEREGAMLSERIPPERDRDGALVPNQGLLLLPEPSPGDLFFDIEGDPFYEGGGVDGIDYLFGVIEPARRDDVGEPAFHAIWSLENGEVAPAAERRAFERLIDLIMDRWRADPGLHVYHYAPYEPGAMKRLAGRHGTREEEVDQLLRGEVFVDLYRAVRGGIRASVESYSLKAIEPLFQFDREIDLRDANASIVAFEEWLELGGDERERGDDTLADIERYNRDDCVSTWRLRDWLEGQRDALAAELDEPLPRPERIASVEREDSEAQKAVRELADKLVEDLPDDEGAWDDAGRARRLLADLLEWHRREDKAFWWRYFELSDLTDEERIGERDALGGLTPVDSWPDPDKPRSTVHRFRFPPQEHPFREGDKPHDPATGRSAGEALAVDDARGTIDLRRGRAGDASLPTSLIPHDLVYAAPKPESQQRVARWVLDHGMDASGPHRAIRDLLMRRPPRAGQAPGESLLRPGEPPIEAARRIALALDGGCLAIQGPPGSGKSTVGATLIVDLVAAGRRVGVTANSHKVVGELLGKVTTVARARGVPVAIGQKAREDNDDVGHGAIFLKKNEHARDGLAAGELDVVGGTAWLWAREDMAESVDTLVIDESGQMSLADVLAAAPRAGNLVLLGDPQQLDQPLQGFHPRGAERSALAHLLDGAPVMPPSRGLFLDGTWRLHPDICAYTSEVFYEGRLRAHEHRERHVVRGGEPPFTGSGIRFLPVAHEGRSSESPEEVALIRERVGALLAGGAVWTDANGREHPLTRDDIVVISPYNAQVRALGAALPGVRVGTVDKFQGQEAPISIYSMATSSAADAPRGMEFLYSLNRLNVATSRARCLTVVAASPELTRALCRTPRQMLLANALARLVEVAEEQSGP